MVHSETVPLVPVLRVGTRQLNCGPPCGPKRKKPPAGANLPSADVAWRCVFTAFMFFAGRVVRPAAEYVFRVRKTFFLGEM